MIRQFLRTRRSPSCTRRFLRDASGAAAVEFGLIMPFLGVLLLGILEFGRVWNVQQVITDATREGTRVAVVSNRLTMNQTQLQDSVRRTIQRRVATAGLETTAPRLTIEADASTGVGGDASTAARVTVQYDYPLMFGQFLMRRDNLLLRSTFVMRNE